MPKVKSKKKRDIRSGRQRVKYAPVFRPVDIEVIGIDDERTFIRLPIAHPIDCGGSNPQGDNVRMRVYVRISKP